MLYKDMKQNIFILGLAMLLSSCTISYKFNGASIDYSKTKSITISEFPNQAALVYTPLTIQFNEALTSKFAQQTRLDILKRGGDFTLEGAITGYQLAATAIGTDNRASENKLTMTVKIHFVNNVTGEEIDQSFSSFRTFSSSSTLNDVQDALITEMIEEVVDQIFNATVANW